MAIQDDNTIVTKGDLKALYTDKIAPYLGANMMTSTNVSDYYSTDEKVAGVWTDGKPVYQRTVFFNPVMYVSSTAWSATSIDVSNVDNIINGEGYSVDGSKQSRPMCFFLDGVLKIMSGRDNVGSDSISGVTYRYTKTTDTAGSATTTPGAYDINFPNTWPKNKEIYFGNGLYGYRWFNGSVTFSGYWHTTSSTNNGVKAGNNIIGYGGNIRPANTTGSSAVNAFYVNNNNTVAFKWDWTSDTMFAEVDAWYTYTK